MRKPSYAASSQPEELPERPFAWVTWPGELDQVRVTQCALSRVCGGCGTSLDRPVAFVGDPVEVARGEFHAPPMHEGCAQQLVSRTVASSGWEVVLTSGFEFVRPDRFAADKRKLFVPNSVL